MTAVPVATQSRGRVDDRQETLAERRRRFLVFSLTVALAAGTVVLLGLVVGPARGVELAPSVTWWMLAGLYAIAEVYIVHLVVGKETHTFSLNEVPLVIGLFGASAGFLVVGQLVGAGLALVFHRHQAIRKVAFNLASFAFSTTIALLVFWTIVDGADPLGPRGWLAAYGAAVAADLTSAFMVQLVIAISTGERPDWSGLLGRGTIYTVINASLGLVAVLLLASRPETVWLAGLLAVAMYLAYRIAISEHEKHGRVLSLHDATRSVEGSLTGDAVARTLLDRAREMFGAEDAELVLLGESADRDPDGVAGRWADAVAAGALRATGADAPVALRSWVQARGIRDLMAAPVDGDDGVMAVLVVMNRQGHVGGWPASELPLLETLANHAAIALQNGHLVDGLAARAAENEYQARHDALTDLPNRTWFERLIDRTLSGPVTATAILTLDLDGFREINDTLGRENGDRILAEVAHRLRSTLVEGECAGRLGSDGFGMMVTRYPIESAATRLAADILHLLEQPFLVEGLHLGLSATIGIALAPRDGGDASTLLRHADRAVLQAQEDHEPYAFYASERDIHGPTRVALIGELRAALEARQLRVWYQPKADMRNGRLLGAEALARWEHPERGLIRPDLFIPVIEHSNLVRPFTLQVLESAITECVGWRHVAPGLGVAVNLSARNLLDRQLPADVDRLLRAARLPANALTLEITESAVMADLDRSMLVLKELRAIGARISIDDFGTGQASLGYLKHLAADELKLDRHFVASLDDDARDRAIVRSTIKLAHDLGMSVVAEGIETRSAWDWLESVDCDVAQGYLIGRPAPAAAFQAYLDKEDTGHHAVPAAAPV